MVLTSKQIEQYRRDGYLVVRDAIDIAPINRLMAFVSHVIRLESGSTEDDEAVLNRVLIELKRAYPTSSSWIYQTLLTSWALKRFFTDIAIEGMAMQLLGIEDDNNLGTVSPAFRFDIPGDQRNVRTWHQDSAYFLENGPGSEHLVAWIPTNAAYKDNGSVLIAPGTHRNGRLGSTHIEAKGLASEQYTAPEDALAGREILHIDAGPGDVAFIDMDLVHSSGVNVTTDSVRYTAQIRFNTINRADYRPVQLKPIYPEYARRG
ncbi:MAG: hypothetical protein EON88_02985 [Brevundimonas sp.]|nr:MAG: hypothetical protein EON88_02985 [Brevundimonas sp.]